MPIVNADWGRPDKEVRWTDLGPQGDPALLEYLDEYAAATGRAPLTPEGPTLELTDWRSDPWCFVALAHDLPMDGLTLSMAGMPELPPIPPSQIS